MATTLVQELNVSLADLMPLKGIVISLNGDSGTHLVSERLHEALRELARERSVSVSTLAKQLRDEINH